MREEIYRAPTILHPSRFALRSMEEGDDGYRRLIAAVVRHALEDATQFIGSRAKPSDPRRQERAEAVAWFMDESDDPPSVTGSITFGHAAGLLGLDPNAVRSAVRSPRTLKRKLGVVR